MARKTLIIILSLMALGLSFYYWKIHPTLLDYLTQEKTLHSIGALDKRLLPKIIALSDTQIERILLMYPIRILLVLILIIFPLRYTLPQKYEKTETTIPTRLFLAGTLLFSLDWYTDLYHLPELSGAYQPTSFYQLFPTLPSAPFLISILFITHLAIGWNILKSKTRAISKIIVVLGFTYIYGLFQCFGKYDHGFIPVVLILLGWSILSFQPLISDAKKQFFIRWIVILPYTLSGFEKLLTSGSETFSNTYLTDCFQSETIATGIMLLVVCFQCFFALSLHQNLRYLFLFAGITFHISVMQVMEVGFWVHPWLLGYLFFFPDHLKVIQERITVCLTKSKAIKNTATDQ
jgi:hypothetical protein